MFSVHFVQLYQIGRSTQSNGKKPCKQRIFTLPTLNSLMKCVLDSVVQLGADFGFHGNSVHSPFVVSKQTSCMAHSYNTSLQAKALLSLRNKSRNASETTPVERTLRSSFSCSFFDKVQHSAGYLFIFSKCVAVWLKESSRPLTLA